MLAFELGEIMSVQEYSELIDWMVKNNYEQEYVKLPDDRLIKWYDDRMIHMFMFPDAAGEPQPEPKIHGPKFEEKKDEPGHPPAA